MNIEVLSSGLVAPHSITSGGPVMVSNGAGTRMHPVALVDRNQSEFLKWGREPRLRRASPISYFMIEAAQQALDAVPGIDRSRVGVVASFFLGCLVYTVRFYKQLTEEGRRFASPILFPETVFNTPVSHLVAALTLGGPIYSQIGDKSCWATALRTAQCWLRGGSADHVLVLGAEEFDPHALDAFHAAGWLSDGMVIGEGAGALLLTARGEGTGIHLAGVADGYGFGNKIEARKAAHSCLAEFSDQTPILSSATSWTRSLEAAVTTGRLLSIDDARHCEAFTARAAWDTIRGINLLKERRAESLIIPYWGLSQQFGSALFVREESSG